MGHDDRALAFAARPLMSVLFIMAGTGKALGFAATVGYFGKLGIPLPEVVAAIVIVIELGGGILLLVGYRLATVATIMALFTIGTALNGHQFWNAEGAQRMQQMQNFLKNLAIVGGFLFVVIDARRRRGR